LSVYSDYPLCIFKLFLDQIEFIEYHVFLTLTLDSLKTFGNSHYYLFTLSVPDEDYFRKTGSLHSIRDIRFYQYIIK
jgi:hypothetical protein